MKTKRAALKMSLIAAVMAVMIGATMFATPRGTTPRVPAAPELTAMDWKHLTPGLPIGGSGVPAVLVTRGAGEIAAGDVITLVQGRQVVGQLDHVYGKVALYRRGKERLELDLPKTLQIQSQFVGRLWARRVNAETEVGELIYSFDGNKRFSSDQELVNLAHNAKTIEYLRNVDGKWVKFVREVKQLSPVSTSVNGNELVGECTDCYPMITGFCWGWVCRYQNPGGPCPCLYCGGVGGGSHECCEIYQ